MKTFENGMLPLLLPIALIFSRFSTHSAFVLFYINAVTKLADFLKLFYMLAFIPLAVVTCNKKKHWGKNSYGLFVLLYTQNTHRVSTQKYFTCWWIKKISIDRW